MTDHPLFSRLLCDVRYSWRDLVLTDLTYKLLAYALLFPLMSLLLGRMLAWTGRTVVADEDILQFVREPLGWLCLIVISALFVAILALEQVALLGIVGAAQVPRHLGVRRALLFALKHSWPVLQITALMVFGTLLAALPFLAAAGIVYATLLTEFDINYYLAHQPPAFQLAVGLAALLGVGLVVVLLRLATSWFCAVPLVVFEGIPPYRALRTSRQRVTGHRRRVLTWILGWLIVSSLISLLGTSAVALLARLSAPQAARSVSLLMVVVGATLVGWTLVNFAAGMLSATSFAALFFRLYAEFASPQEPVGAPGSTGDVTQLGGRWAWTRRRFLAAVAGAALVSTAVGYAALHRVRVVDEVQVIAHRGASHSAPENTIAAIEQAVAEGADSTEIDVQETADGQVVLFHDRDFKRQARNPLRIYDATLANLQDLDIGSWFGAEFQDQRVPTLGQVLDYCQGKIDVTIELKYYAHNQQLEQRVIDLVEAHAMEDHVVIISLRQDMIDRVKQLRPEWKTGLLTAVAVGNLTKSNADILAVNAHLASISFIRSAHRAGKQVYVWTVNDPLTMSAMIGRDVDGLITDRPGMAREVLAAREDLGAVERLLLQTAALLGIKREVVAQ